MHCPRRWGGRRLAREGVSLEVRERRGERGRERTIFAFDSGDVGYLLDVEEGGNSGHEIFAKRRVAGYYVCESPFVDVRDEERGIILGKTLGYWRLIRFFG